MPSPDPSYRQRVEEGVWETAIAVVKKEQDDYLATAAELAKQTGNDNATDVFTANASVTMQIVEALEAARTKAKEGK